MDLILTLFLLLSFTVWGGLIINLHNSRLRKSIQLPPGPKPFPIIGNILALGQKPHHSLTKLSKIYGPLMSLQLGRITTVVVSSPEMAKIILQKYDQIFANRTHPDAIRALDHHKFSVAWIPLDTQWRKLRKICKEHMFSVGRLDESQGLRREKLQQLCDYVNECSINGQAVDIGRAAFTTSLNLVSATLFSMDFAAFGSDSSQEFKDVVWGIMEVVGKPNLADYFPILQFVDLQNILRKNEFYFKKCFAIFDEIIGQRLEARRESSGNPKLKNDMLEELLDLNQKPEFELSFDDIKHLLLDLFVAGTDTSSGTVEWVMAELLRNPEKMLNLRNELKSVVGQNEQVQESDIVRLPYLRAVIKETFRIHPVVPLSLPHKPTMDIEINGYLVPKNSQILVNVYAIGRDSNLWSDPELFMPERFLEQEIDFRGQHFELIPFGAGRRICVGLPLAYRMVHLMVATFIHNFDWKVEGANIDMSEKFGLTLAKATPLKAIPVRNDKY